MPFGVLKIIRLCLSSLILLVVIFFMRGNHAEALIFRINTVFTCTYHNIGATEIIIILKRLLEVIMHVAIENEEGK